MFIKKPWINKGIIQSLRNEKGTKVYSGQQGRPKTALLVNDVLPTFKFYIGGPCGRLGYDAIPDWNRSVYAGSNDNSSGKYLLEYRLENYITISNRDGEPTLKSWEALMSPHPRKSLEQIKLNA